MMKQLLLLPALALLTLAGCDDDHDRGCGPKPRTSCVQGTVVGKTCYDGVLIQVTGSALQGRPWGSYSNVIATGTDLTGLDAQGQTVYFNYRPYGSAEWMPRPCPAIGTPADVPRLVLTNASATACRDVVN